MMNRRKRIRMNERNIKIKNAISYLKSNQEQMHMSAKHLIAKDDFEPMIMDAFEAIPNTFEEYLQITQNKKIYDDCIGLKF